MVWLTIFHGDERTFWRTMTPARLDRLIAVWLGDRAPARSAPPSGGSLSQYLMGGG